MSDKKWLVIDCDAGVDDAVALVLAHKLGARHGFELKLIMCSFGNVDLPQVFKNVKRVSSVCCARVPIARGSSDPVASVKRINATYFHGKDGLGDVPRQQDEEVDENKEETRDAVSSFLQLCTEAHEQRAHLTLVTLGPLTNLCLALSSNRAVCLDTVKHLVIMGGCANGRGNFSRTAEFNVAADPEAATQVFAAPWEKVTVVSWELCLKFAVEWPVFDALIENDGRIVDQRTCASILTPVGKFVRDICWLSYVAKRDGGTPTTSTKSDSESGTSVAVATTDSDFSVDDLPELPALPSLSSTSSSLSSSSLQKRSSDGAVICDALAMAVVLNENIVELEAMVHIDIELNGTHTRGQTVVDFGHCYDDVDRTLNVHWVQEVNRQEFYSMLHSALHE